MSGKIIPLKKPEPARPAPPSPWILGEVFTRDGVDYELVTVGEIKVVELGCSEEASSKHPRALGAGRHGRGEQVQPDGR